MPAWVVYILAPGGCYRLPSEHHGAHSALASPAAEQRPARRNPALHSVCCWSAHHCVELTTERYPAENTCTAEWAEGMRVRRVKGKCSAQCAAAEHGAVHCSSASTPMLHTPTWQSGFGRTKEGLMESRGCAAQSQWDHTQAALHTEHIYTY